MMFEPTAELTLHADVRGVCEMECYCAISSGGACFPHRQEREQEVRNYLKVKFSFRN